MGSGSSRMGARPSRPRSDHRPKLNFATFLCGGTSTSATAPQIGDRPSEKLVLPARLHASMARDHLQYTVMESPLTSESSSSSSMNEHLRSNLVRFDSGLKESSPLSQNAETSYSGKCFSESKELVPCLSSASSDLSRTLSRRTCNLENTSSKPTNLETPSINADTPFIPVVEAVDSINDSFPPPFPVRFSSGISQLAPEDMPANGNLTTGIHGACSTLRSAPSILSSNLNLLPEEPLSEATFVPVAEAVDSINDPFSPPYPVRFSSGVSRLTPEDMPANGNLTTEIHGGSSTVHSAPSILSSDLNLLPEEHLSVATSSGVDILTVGERRHGGVLHVDVVSISSNIIPDGTGDVNSNEARRNSRRLFWDAFSRRSTRRNHDSAILSSTEDNDDLGSHDRWLLDISDDLFGSRFDRDSMYLHRRGYGSNGRRWHSRSEIRERLRFGFDNDRRQTTFCPSGLHRDGRCSCDSLFRHEESSTRASISRIVMLAEALFEVLDEIHRQPVSLSLSMVSLPAPESVVNSLPVKSHIKHDATRTADDIEQCYICLAEYEEGDKIRILPCRHEYHMSCVDKWLKEIHGVCPLCRGDVCEGTAAHGTAEVTM